MNDETVIVIPARLESKRLPKKPLCQVTKHQTLIEAVVRRARETGFPVAVATDSNQVRNVVGNLCDVIISSVDYSNGTDRVIDAATCLFGNPKVVINWQGDAPLILPDDVIRLAQTMHELRATRAAKKMKPEVVGTLTAPIPHPECSPVYVQRGDLGLCLAFSRRHDVAMNRSHQGVYAYTPEARELIRTMGVSLRAQQESLEQLSWVSRIPIYSIDVRRWLPAVDDFETLEMVRSRLSAA